MSKKYLRLAICTTILTMVYYSWMIWSWVHLDKVKINKGRYRDSKSETEFGTSNERCLENLPTLDDLNRKLGEEPPTYSFWIKEPKYQCDSVLKINTSSGASYVVKIVDSYNDEVIMMFYLPSGVSEEIDIPSGRFQIRYTSGTRWFGEDEMFGPTAAYAKADRDFTFSKGSGYELTLYRVKNGNLRTSFMRKEDF